MDHRDIANKVHLPYVVDEKRGVIILDTYDEEGNDITLDLPLKWEVCGTCNGAGSHVNPSIDSNGLSAEDFADDPDFEHDYFSGAYDIPCNECGGRRVTATSSDPRFEKVVNDAWRDAYEDERIRRAENGYYGY